MIVCLVWPWSAAAVELRPAKVKTGTEGLISVPVEIANTGRDAIACTAQLAHWYSLEAASAAPGAMARIDLWFEPASGTYVLLNASQENMPVEALWCGIAGHAYATRAPIRLNHAAAAARSIACSGIADRLVCK